MQFVERITTAHKGVRRHLLKARRNHELGKEPKTFQFRQLVSDPQPNALTQHEPVSRWTDEVAQTQDMEFLLPPQNEERTRAEINGHSRSSSFAVVEMVVLQFLSTSQRCGTVVKVQFEDESVRACHFRADKQLTEYNRLSDERGRCLPLVPTSQSKHVVQSDEAMDRPVAQETTTSTKRVSALGPAQSKKVDVAGVVQKTVEELLGTVVPNDAPLMGAGLDSIAAVELISTLSQNLNIEIEPTALFDYPTIASLAKYFAGMEPAEAVVLPSLPQASVKPRAQVDVAEVVAKAVEELLGTIVPDDAPLMGAGLDSIAAVELVATLSQNLSTDIEPTLLFDHPTIGSLVRYFAAEMEPSSMTSALDSSDIL